VTKNQQMIYEILKRGKWMSAKDISEKTGIRENHVRTSLSTKVFLHLQKGIKDTGLNNGGRYVKVYKYVKPQVNPSDEALELSKKHAGLFGQLYWAANHDKKIVLVDET
jgi:predicted ArsR family transcriptional regulator